MSKSVNEGTNEYVPTSTAGKVHIQTEPFELLPDGRARLLIPEKKLTKQQFNKYHTVNRQWYKHHKGAKHRYKFNEKHEESLTVEKDPAITRYFTVIKNRPRAEGFLSPRTRGYALNSVRHFLTFLNIPITENALSTLIKSKKDNPQDFTLDDQIEAFANPPNNDKLQSRRAYAIYILGIFKANRARLSAQVNNHFATSTSPISDGILKEIRSHLDQRGKDLMDLQAYAGQRIKAIATIPLSQIDTNRNDFAILHIQPSQNKTRQKHECIVPIQLMKRIIERAKKLHSPTPFPNYEQIWKDITKFAQEYYNIRLTSHYLRKRFATIASDTPMDVNQWDYLMGTKKSKGHDASVYNLTFIDRLIKSYNTYLVNALSLEETPKQEIETNNESTDTTNKMISQLEKTILSQAQQIQQLTELVSALNEKLAVS